MKKIDESLGDRFSLMKVICVFMIVLIHTKPSCLLPDSTIKWAVYLGGEGVCRIAVPFFFLASGFFWAGHCDETRWRLKELHKRVWSLLVPFVLWTVISGVVYFVFSTFGLVDAPVSNDQYVKIMGLDLVSLPWYGQLWFLRALMIVVLVYTVMPDCVLRNRNRLLLLTIAFGLVYSIGRPFVGYGPWPFGYTISLEGFFYFTIGVFLRLYPIRLKLSRPLAGICVCVGCGLIVLMVTMIFGRCDMRIGRYLGFLAIPILIAGVFYVLPGWKPPRCVIAATFPCFLLHRYVLMACGASKKIKTPYVLEDDVWAYFAAAVFSFAFSICIAILMARVFPRTNAILFGERAGRTK